MSLFSAFSDFLHPPPPDPAVAAALARIGELVSPSLPADPDFTRRLSAPAAEALAYCSALVTALPSPISISHGAFARDPLVHALFATADDIHQMLGRSQAVRDYIAEPASLQSADFYALFAARRQEKRQLGMAVQGDVVQSDVPQCVLFFSDQTLVEPCTSLPALQEALVRRAIDSLLLTFHDHLAALRHERDGLRGDLAAERAHLTPLHGSTPGLTRSAHSRHIEALSEHLRQTASALLPDQLVGALAAFLSHPAPYLTLQPLKITVDRLGIVRQEAAEDEEGIHTLDFHELHARDRRRYLVMLARIERAEAEAAVAAVRDQQHRFLLI